MRFTPSLIWRYVFREVMSPVLLGLMIYVLVFLMNALFELAELAIKKEMPPSVVLRLLMYLLPRVLEMTLPMAALLGILIGVGRLSADSELIALRASGVSYLKIVSPVLVLALTCWGISSILMHRIEPRAQYKKRRLFSEQLYTTDLRRELKPRVFFEELQGMLVYADEVYQGGDFLERVFIHQTDAEGREVVTLARRAQIDYDRHSGTAQFFLENGTNHTMTPGEPESYQISRFEKQKFVRPPDESFKMRLGLLSRDSPRNYQEQSLEELGKTAKQAGSITHVPTRERVIGSIMVVMHERFALPFACLAFAFVGVPLGIANRRGGKASGFSLSIGIAIVYWLLYSVGQNLVREGKIAPVVGMWAANALLAGLGLFLLFLRERFEGLDVRLLIPDGVRIRIARFLRIAPGADAGGTATGPDELERARAELDSDEIADRVMLSRRRIGHIVVGAGIAAVGLAAFYLTPFLTVGLVLMATILLFSTTLDRHVLGRYLLTLAGCVASFFTLFAVYEFIQLLDDIAQPGQKAGVASYLLFRVPWMLSQVLPMSCLMSCFLTYGVMSRFNEVTAVKASGTSIYRLSVPIIMVTLALSVLAYVNYDYLVPFANQRAMQIRDVIRGRSPRSYQVGDRRWVFGSGGRLYNYRNYVPPPLPVLPAAGAGTFEGFSVYFLDPVTFEMKGRLYARSATFQEGKWLLREGWSREFHPDGEVFERFVEKRMALPEGPTFFVKEWKTPEQMNFAELRRLVADLKTRGYDAQELMVDLYTKTSFPLVPLTLIIIGLPFCFRIGRKGSLYGIGIAILVAALYFLTFSAASALGGTGVMPAFLAAWAPNLIFAGTGAYLLLRTNT